MSNDSTKWLYDNLTAKGYNVGKDLAEFDSLLINNEDSRQWVYDTAKSEGWNVGKDYDEFTNLVAPATPQTQEVPPLPEINNNAYTFSSQELEIGLSILTTLIILVVWYKLIKRAK